MREIVRRIDLWGVNMLFVVGGNGGNAAANAIQRECEASKVLCAVIGVPKSIDNDILLVRLHAPLAGRAVRCLQEPFAEGRPMQLTLMMMSWPCLLQMMVSTKLQSAGYLGQGSTRPCPSARRPGTANQQIACCYSVDRQPKCCF